MYDKQYTKFVLFILLLGAFFPGLAMYGEEQRDPYGSMRYSEAFNQKGIWKKYDALMNRLGCAHNIADKGSSLQMSQSEAVATTKSSGDLSEELEQYQKECVNQLNNARRYALAEPGLYAATEIALISIGAIAAISLLGQESMGGSFAGYASIFNTLYRMKGVIKSGYNLILPPDNSLKIYEDRFAQNKCFIPQVLWPKIIRELVSARQNEFSREKNCHFLDFALGFTIYKPLASMHTALSPDELKQELSHRIDKFFESYSYGESTAKEVETIRLNVAKFVDLLFDRSTSAAPRYVYLYGPGGVGKTYFVELLSKWINELLPGAVNYENVVINLATELEGNAERPGALLKVLRNQLMQNKRGSIMVLDEATWLNNPAMTPAAKRTFNADQSKLCTAYFGDGPEGDGVHLTIPPILVFVASNDDVKDEALASRFDFVHYPQPCRDTLIAHAYNVAQESAELRRIGVLVTKGDIAQWIENLDTKQLNFRFVEGAVEAEFLARAKAGSMAH